MRAQLGSILLVCAAALLAGCPDKSTSGDGAAQDRTLMKLKEAKEKGPVGVGPPVAEDEARDKLAKVATGGADDGGPRPLPANNATVHLGTVAVKLAALETSPMVKGAKLTLSTDQTFLFVRLVAQNVGERAQELELSSATLTTKAGELPLARDAQRVGGTKDLHLKFGPAAEQKSSEMTLIFELPPDALGSGIVLNLIARMAHR